MACAQDRYPLMKPWGSTVPINSCTNITSPGTYILTQNIINSTANDACIKIKSSDVVFDCAGYTIDGVDTPYNDGIVVHFNESVALTNVTVKNVTLTDWDYGIIYKNVSNGKIASVTASSNNEWEHGIHIDVDKDSIVPGVTYNFSVVVRVNLTGNEAPPILYKPKFAVGMGFGDGTTGSGTGKHRNKESRIYIL